MVNKTISLPYEINEKLKGEHNASGLITELLTRYFKEDTKETQEDLDKKIKSIEHEKRDMLDKLEREKKQLTGKKEILEKQVEVEIEEKQIGEGKEKYKQNSIRSTFYDETGRDMTTKELEDYLVALKLDNANLFQWIKENAE